jgi:hypothetical protein
LSFDLILDELLSGQLAFSEELTQSQIAFIFGTTEVRPSIPEFVISSIQVLITDCWAQEPSDRSTFETIVERLAEIRFKLISNVNSTKLSTFIKMIDEWKTRNVEQ